MKFLDLFAGIGGFRMGLTRAGHEPFGWVEIDKFARQSYQAIYDGASDEWNRTDITKVTDQEWSELNGTVDIIAGGFPCQSFSIAGKRQGFLDQTKGTLFFEVARAAKQIQPEWLFLENVKGLLNHDKGNTFRTILSTLDELGFDVEWCVLNSKDFGVPQNRERVYIIGHSRTRSGREVFPFFGENGTANQAVVNQLGNISNSDSFGGNPQTGRVYGTDGVSPTLNTMQGGGREPKIAIPTLTPDRINKRQNGRRFKENGDPMFTLTAQDKHGVLVREATKKGYDIATVGDSINISQPNSQTRRGRVGHGVANTLVTSAEQANIHENMGELRIRKLTPKECWRLQSFPDWAFNKAQQAGLSDSQLYKQAGNSVTVNVIYYIGSKLHETSTN